MGALGYTLEGFKEFYLVIRDTYRFATGKAPKCVAKTKTSEKYYSKPSQVSKNTIKSTEQHLSQQQINRQNSFEDNEISLKTQKSRGRTNKKGSKLKNLCEEYGVNYNNAAAYKKRHKNMSDEDVVRYYLDKYNTY